MWTTLGPELSADSEKRAFIVCALYGLKYVGADFRAHIGKCMQGLEYEPCLADPDLWINPEARPNDHY